MKLITGSIKEDCEALELSFKKKSIALLEGGANIATTLYRYNYFTDYFVSEIEQTEKITIIITNYNKGDLLKNAVRSALEQTYKNIEIIIIDDNSKDNLKKILKKTKDKRIKCFKSNVNYGTYGCRNYGIDISSGDYITFLDADDIMDENHLSNLMWHLKLRNLVSINSLYLRQNSEDKNDFDIRLCEASILFNKKEIIESIGYFHTVRAGADMEFRERLNSFFGNNNMGLSVPWSYIALFHANNSPDSLTRSVKGRARLEYANSFKKWHNESNDLYFDYKSMDMPFEVNKEIATNPVDSKSFKKIKL
jgi:glycosyltransferase involved in cell wall biosynthesis